MKLKLGFKEKQEAWGHQSKRADKCQQQQVNISPALPAPRLQTQKDFFKRQRGVSSSPSRLLCWPVIQQGSQFIFNLVPCDTMWTVIAAYP